MGGKSQIKYEDNREQDVIIPCGTVFQFSKSVLEFGRGRGSLLKVYTVDEALAKSMKRKKPD